MDDLKSTSSLPNRNPTSATNHRNYPQGVIFTHFGSLASVSSLTEFHRREDELIEKLKPIIKSYLECNSDRHRIQIVYGYVDWAVRMSIPDLKVTEHEGRRSFSIDAAVLRQETQLFGILRAAERNARKELDLFWPHPPKFHFIGLTQLLDLLNNLIDVEPQLVRFLCGAKGRFGYDSPKFVEAIIRLARGDIPHLAGYPIIRIDEDAVVSASSIDKLLETFKKVSASKPFFFFSGRYGRFDDKPDPVNNHAVRVHWFYPLGTKASDDKFQNGDEKFEKANELTRKFLSDLSVIGATQRLDYKRYLSANARTLLDAGELNYSNRGSMQVISGAGLIMARRAVRMLPPFMHFDHLTTWIDDFLKRLLHEMLRDIVPEDVESVENAFIQQDRHPSGIRKEDMEWANEKYFKRLLRGCIMHAMIMTPAGNPTDYSNIIRDIAWGKIGQIRPKRREELKKSLYDYGIDRLENVLKCWSSPEFRGTHLFSWIKDINNIPEFNRNFCNAVLEDAIGYVDLLLNWQIFTSAVERLSFIGNDWLYDEVD